MSPSEVAEAVAVVCERRERMHGLLLKGAEDPSPLDRCLAAVRSGTEVSEQLDELDAALRQAGDALGVYGHLAGGGRGGSYGARPFGMGDPVPLEVVDLCPHGVCTRWSGPDPAAASPPRCEVYGEPLRRERL